MGEGNQVNIDQDHYHDSQWRIQGGGGTGGLCPPLDGWTQYAISFHTK